MKQLIFLLVLYAMCGTCVSIDAQIVNLALKSPFRMKNVQSFAATDFFGERWSVGGSGNLVVNTSDAQKSYTIVRKSYTISTFDLNSIFFPDYKTGFVVGDSGEILLTRDHGLTWKHQETSTKDDLESIHCLDLNNCWAVGGKNGTLLTGGASGKWTSRNIVSDGRLTDVFIADKKTGYIVGWADLVLKTSDGGETWYRINIPYEMEVSELVSGVPNYETVSFKDAATGCVAGWAIGAKIIACTSDGGKKWNVSYPRINPIGLVWYSHTEVYAIARNGKNLVSNDQGKTWRSAK